MDLIGFMIGMAI